MRGATGPTGVAGAAGAAGADGAAGATGPTGPVAPTSPQITFSDLNYAGGGNLETTSYTIACPPGTMAIGATWLGMDQDVATVAYTPVPMDDDRPSHQPTGWHITFRNEDIETRRSPGSPTKPYAICLTLPTVLPA